MQSTNRWHVLENAAAVATEAERRILAPSRTAIAERGVFRIVLAGGHTPTQTYRMLAETEMEWSG